MKKGVPGKVVDLVKGLVKMAFLTLLNEVVLHCIYFRPLALTPSALRNMNLWALGGVVFWLGKTIPERRVCDTFHAYFPPVPQSFKTIIIINRRD